MNLNINLTYPNTVRGRSRHDFSRLNFCFGDLIGKHQGRCPEVHATPHREGACTTSLCTCGCSFGMTNRFGIANRFLMSFCSRIQHKSQKPKAGMKTKTANRLEESPRGFKQDSQSQTSTRARPYSLCVAARGPAHDLFLAGLV